jgi:hypothetical protein
VLFSTLRRPSRRIPTYQATAPCAKNALEPGYVKSAVARKRSGTDLEPGKLRVACVRLSGRGPPDAGV